MSATSIDTRYDIRVAVNTEFLPAQSNPGARRYAFAYHIAITNGGTVGAQLLTRHWIITDGNQHVQEVRGEGVVGEKPVLAPGQVHRYSSGAVLETPVGVMQGSYGMLAADGTRFEAPIAPFRLAVPGALN
jgi:ApaG protein